MNILIIEPDRELGRTMSGWFRVEGWQSDVAHTSQDALDALDKSNYNLIILELVIPSSNGVEFLQELRSYPEWQDIPCIIYTRVALGSISTPEVFGDLGVLRILYKSKDSLEYLSELIKDQKDSA